VKSEAQAFRSEANGSLPLTKAATSGAMSSVVKDENGVLGNKTTLKCDGSMPSLLQAHAPLKTRNVNSGMRDY
jgi:hypothetical protein